MSRCPALILSLAGAQGLGLGGSEPGLDTIEDQDGFVLE